MTHRPSNRASVLDAGPRLWLVVVLLLALAASALPFDGAIAAAVKVRHLPADLKRELLALQQFGQLSVTVLIAIAFCALAPERWRRVLDLGLAMAATGVVTRILKWLIGRPRPIFGDPWAFAGPFGEFDPEAYDASVRPWTDDYFFTSMPSSHAASAVVLALFLVVADRRLDGLAIGLALAVGACRIVLTSHYPSDVFVGAAVGLAVAAPIFAHHVGVRALDRAWRVFDRSATPALPALRRAESARARRSDRRRTRRRSSRTVRSGEQAWMAGDARSPLEDSDVG